jgi:regulator of replication initiation timing
MADGSITFSTALDNKELEKQLSSLTKKIGSIQDKLSQKTNERIPLVEQAQALGVELDAAKAKLYEMQVASKNTFSSEQIKDQQIHVSGLQREWNSVQGSVERYDSAISKASSELSYSKEKAVALEGELASASKWPTAMGSALEGAQTKLSKFTSKMSMILRSVVGFTLVFQAFAAFQTWISGVITANSDASAALAQLKAAFLTMVQPILNVVIPAFAKFLNILSAIIMAIARITAKLFGTTVQDSEASAKALNDQTTALNDTSTAAKKATKAFASFDEIQQLTTSDSSGSSGSSAADAAIAPDFSSLKGFDTKEYENKVDEITAYVSGALLALGVLLTFSGVNIPLGLALIAAGAVGLASVVTGDWSTMDGNVKNAINQVFITLGSSFLVIGAILAFSGVNLPIGLGLMMMGAVSLGTAATLNWNSLSGNIQTSITAISLVLSAATLVVGAILAISGVNIPLGIGLIAVGALALGTAGVLNWDSLSKEIQTVITAIAVIIGTALLVIGGVLAFSGSNIPLGIALIAAGALVLATAAVLNWDSLSKSVSTVVTAIFTVVGAALLVIGSILAFSGTNIPLGIGLMIAGAAALGTAAVLNWNAVSDALHGQIGALTIYVGAALLVLGAILCFTGVGIPLGIALIAAGAASLATVIALNWTSMEGPVGTAISTLLTIVSAATLVLGVLLCLTGAGIPLGISLIMAGAKGLVSASTISSNPILDFIKNVINGAITLVENGVNYIVDVLNSISWTIPDWVPGVGGQSWGFNLPRAKIPRLATGAVIPPNSEFLAVLGDQKSGTNIEAPLETIVKAFKMAGGGSGEFTFNNVIELDGEVIYKNQQKVSRRHGTSLSDST